MSNNYYVKYNNQKTDIEDLIFKYTDGRLPIRTFRNFLKSDNTTYEWSYPNVLADPWRRQIDITDKLKSGSQDTCMVQKGCNPNCKADFDSNLTKSSSNSIIYTSFWADYLSAITFEFYGKINIKRGDAGIIIEHSGKKRTVPNDTDNPTESDYGDNITLTKDSFVDGVVPDRIIVVLSGPGGPASSNDGGGGSGAAAVYVLKLESSSSMYWTINISKGIYGDDDSYSESEARQQVKDLKTDLWLNKLENTGEGEDEWRYYKIVDLGCGTHPYKVDGDGNEWRGGLGGQITPSVNYNSFVNDYFWGLYESDGAQGADEGAYNPRVLSGENIYSSTVTRTADTKLNICSKKASSNHKNAGEGASSIFYVGGSYNTGDAKPGSGRAGSGAASKPWNSMHKYGWGGCGACVILY